jgi:hypothetical protein
LSWIVGYASSPEGARAGSCECRFEQPAIADLRRACERSLRDVQQILEIEEDHRPRRSSASA